MKQEGGRGQCVVCVVQEDSGPDLLVAYHWHYGGCRVDGSMRFSSLPTFSRTSSGWLCKRVCSTCWCTVLPKYLSCHSITSKQALQHASSALLGLSQTSQVHMCTPVSETRIFEKCDASRSGNLSSVRLGPTPLCQVELYFWKLCWKGANVCRWNTFCWKGAYMYKVKAITTVMHLLFCSYMDWLSRLPPDKDRHLCAASALTRSLDFWSCYYL